MFASTHATRQTPVQPAPQPASLDTDTALDTLQAAIKGRGGASRPWISQCQAYLVIRQHHQAIAAEDTTRGWRRAIVSFVVHLLETVADEEPDGADILRRRLVDRQSMRFIISTFPASKKTIERRQAAALALMAELLAERERIAREQRTAAFLVDLPPQNHKLFVGTDAHMARAVGCLLEPDNRDVVLITGLGGIGKTTLAGQVARVALATFRFDRLVFVAPDEYRAAGDPKAGASYTSVLAAIARRLFSDGTDEAALETRVVARLRTAPVLVIIDGLDQPAELAYILARFAQFSGNSRFVVTSRFAVVDLPTVLRIELDELVRADSRQLVQHVAPHLSAHETEQLCATVGGHPQALTLVAALSHRIGSAAIVRGLARGTAPGIDGMYERIYGKAWQVLPNESRLVLQAMALTGESGTAVDFLMEVAGLGEARFWRAIEELHYLSLIERRTDDQWERFGIHHLTGTYLQQTALRTADADYSDAFAAMVARSIAYWHQRRPAATTAPISPHDWAALMRTVGFGLEIAATRLDAAHLILAQHAYVEVRALWRDWLPVVERAAAVLAASDPTVYGRLLYDLGTGYHRTRRFAQARNAFDTGIELAQASGNQAELGRHRYGAAFTANLEQRLDDAYDTALAARSALTGTREQHGALFSEAENLLGMICYFRGDYEQSVAHYAAAVAEKRLHGHPDEIARLMGNLAQAQVELGQLDAAVATLEEALAVFTGARRPLQGALLRVKLSYAYRQGQQYERARAAVAPVEIATLLQQGQLDLAGYVSTSLGVASMRLARFDAAQQHLTNAVNWLSQFGDERYAGSVYGYLAELFAIQGRSAEQAAALKQAEARLAGNPQDQWSLDRLDKIRDALAQYAAGE